MLQHKLKRINTTGDFLVKDPPPLAPAAPAPLPPPLTGYTKIS